MANRLPVVKKSAPKLTVREVHKCIDCGLKKRNALGTPCQHSFCVTCLEDQVRRNPRYGDWRKAAKGYTCPLCEVRNFEAFESALRSLEMNMIGPNLKDATPGPDRECSYCKNALCEDCIIVRVVDCDTSKQEHTLIGLSGNCSVMDMKPYIAERDEKKKREIKTGAVFTDHDRHLLESLPEHQLLTLLLHAKKCIARGNRGPPCKESYCDAFKVAVVHKDVCQEGPNCRIPLCHVSKKVWEHWTNCTAKDCHICHDQAQLAIR